MYPVITVLIIIFGYAESTKNLPCPPSLSLDITNGSKSLDGRINITGTIFQAVDYYEENDNIFGCICNVRACIRKCCDLNQARIHHKGCENRTNSFNLSITDLIAKSSVGNANFYFHYSEFCESGVKMRINYDEEEFFLKSDGQLHLPFVVGTPEENLSPARYCLDQYFLNGTEYFSALICYEDDGDVFTERQNTTGMIISMPFLLATFIAYALLPDRNLHMKALMSYVLNLLLGYIFLVSIQLNNNQYPPGVCTFLGYSSVFTFMASFLWMNVICIDIWFAFSGLRGFAGGKKAEAKRFLFYNIYAWGMAIFIVVVIALVDKYNTSESSSWYAPHISQGQCFLSSGYPELFYFYGPMAVIIVSNIVLFSVTAFKIRSVKKETSMLKKDDSRRHSYENDKQKFNLYLKLLFAMGINWSMEIISWAVDWKFGNNSYQYVWYLTDFCNAMYGVLIFFIFVFKRSIWKHLQKRYYSFTGRPNLAHSMTTNPTRTTSYSTASTTVRESNPRGANDATLLTSEA